MLTRKNACLLVLLAAINAPAMAHRTWILPSHTRISSAEGQWVTFDFSASNDLYYPSKPMDPNNLLVREPSGVSKPVVNVHSGALRVVFDYQFTSTGTYRIGQVKSYDTVSFKTAKGEQERRRGNWDDIRKTIPADATDISRMAVHARNETYVTVGSPTTTVLKPEGKGLELIANSHPNDLYDNEAVEFGFHLNGKPIAGLTVLVTPDTSRFRDQQNSIELKTDEKGLIGFRFPHAGRYLLEAESEQSNEQGQALYRYFVTLEAEHAE